MAQTTIDFKCPRCHAEPGAPCVWKARTNPHNTGDFHLARADVSLRRFWSEGGQA